jgi:hypothetical protein
MAGHLRLVRDEPPKPRKKWRRAPTLSHEEQARIRAALKHARVGRSRRIDSGFYVSQAMEVALT